MDPKTYIQSGILEQYVLGKLSEVEVSEVERFASQYPEIREEINSIEAALKEYAMLHGKTPPPGILSEVLSKIDAQTAEVHKTSSANNKTAIIITVVIAALLGLMAGYFYQQNQNLQASLDDLATQMAIQQASCDSLSTQTNELKREIEFLRRPSTQSIIMKGTDRSPDAIASVFYNTEEEQTILNVVDLPEPPTGKQYQLWAFVEGENAPVSVGVFDLQQDIALQDVQFIASAQNFAISLEDEGGSPVPTDVHLVGTGIAGKG